MHWLLCRLRNAWMKVEWWCAPQRSDEWDAFSVQREAGLLVSLSICLSLSLSHLIILCTWTDARTCLLNLRSKSHSFHRETCTRSQSGCKVRVLHGDIWTQFPSASSLRDGNMEKTSSDLSMSRPWDHFGRNVHRWQKGEELFFFWLQFQALNVYSNISPVAELSKTDWQ